MKKMILCFFTLFFLISGCQPKAPELPPLEATTPVQTSYTSALHDLNTILEIYLSPNSPTFHYYVKPIRDTTGISATGEIPFDITTMVRDAISQVYYKIRYVEQYDDSDLTHLQVENILLANSKMGVTGGLGIRPRADYTIAGSISQFDRNLQSTSANVNAMASFGGGSGRTDLNASANQADNLSRLGVSFNVYTSNGESYPGKYGASVELAYAKNGVDLGFSILGNGLGFGSEATAMHGRHFALQMMCELSVVQIIGRTINIPYWRVGATHKIFQEDPIVIKCWRLDYNELEANNTLTAFMQAQCIANGDMSVQVTGIMDTATQQSLQAFAAKYNVRGSLTSFELYKALELNRKLDTDIAHQAWTAYNNYKNGNVPAVQQLPAVKQESKQERKPQSNSSQSRRSQEVEEEHDDNYEELLKDFF